MFTYFYLLKSGRTSTKALYKPTYEDRLLGINGEAGMIEKGSLTDKDINYILDSNDPKLLKCLDKKYQKEKKNSEHVQRMYGKDWTNKDNDGNLFKDTTLYDPGTERSTKESIKNYEENINPKTNA